MISSPHVLSGVFLSPHGELGVAPGLRQDWAAGGAAMGPSKAMDCVDQAREVRLPVRKWAGGGAEHL